MSTYCAQCQKTQNATYPTKPLSKCSKCGATYYCSRECQVAHWPQHKSSCSKLSSSSVAKELSSLSIKSTQAIDPWESFKPFIDSISTELLSILSIPYAPFVHSKNDDRKGVWYHLHFRFQPTLAQKGNRRAFELRGGRRSSQKDFIEWARNEKSHQGQEVIIESYRKRIEAIEQGDSAPATQDTKSVRRLFCTAENEHQRFLGLSIVVLSSNTVTRSALAPRNEELDWVTPMQTILGAIEPDSRSIKLDPEAPESTDLLHKIVKEFMKDDQWAKRSLEDYRNGDTKEIELIHAALCKRGIKEQVLIGGRLGKGYYYAVPISEFPTKCTCGRTHLPEEHYLEEEDEDEYDSDEDGATPPYHNSHHGHSHDDGTSCGASHSHDNHCHAD